MKPIKETIEKIVAFEASDGTRFENENECLKYEQTASVVIKDRFRRCIIKKMCVEELTESGLLALCDVGEDWYVALIDVRNEDTLMAINMFAESVGSKYKLSPEEIGKKIVASVGEESLSWFYPYGTIGTCVEAYRNNLLKLIQQEGE